MGISLADSPQKGVAKPNPLNQVPIAPTSRLEKGGRPQATARRHCAGPQPTWEKNRGDPNGGRGPSGPAPGDRLANISATAENTMSQSVCRFHQSKLPCGRGHATWVVNYPGLFFFFFFFGLQMRSIGMAEHLAHPQDC